MENNNNLELRVSAPGKLILFGEHSVVYGKRALAAGLKLRSQLILRELPNSERAEFELPGVGLSIKLPIVRLQDDLLLRGATSVENEDDPKLLEFARELAKAVCKSEDERKILSLECTLYALARVAQAEGLRGQLPAAGGFLLKLTTEVPLGAGLGSSASFSVCLAAGFLIWARIRSGGDQIKDSKTLRQQISRHALGCERIMHGAPSGVDNEVCTFGSAIEFRKGEEPRQLPFIAEFRVLLVDTRVARSTRWLVDKLARLHAQYPQIFDAIFEAMDQVCRRAIEIITNAATTTATDSMNRELSNLIDINMGLLTACQVSHPSIDSICATAKKHGFSAKLTGAGGGGFVYVLVPPDVSANELYSDLIANGFSVIETKVGDSGLDISYDFHR